VGLYFVERGAAPRATSVLYDRAHSAMSQIEPGSIAWKTVFKGARWFHVSGITPALGGRAAAVTLEALKAAKAAGLTVSYDLNYRRKLWTPAHARRVQTPLMRYVDVLISTEEDTDVVFGIKGGRSRGTYSSVDATSYDTVARELQRRFKCTAVAITLRENPRVWLNTWRAIVRAGNTTYESPQYEVEVVDRIGAGDAFCAGLIFGALTFDDWDAAVKYGAALSALKHTIPGDFSLSTRGEVEELLRGKSLRVAR
jgi:2-dehydro-3-deoxygluconokinase